MADGVAAHFGAVRGVGRGEGVVRGGGRGEGAVVRAAPPGAGAWAVVRINRIAVPARCNSPRVERCDCPCAVPRDMGSPAEHARRGESRGEVIPWAGPAPNTPRTYRIPGSPAASDSCARSARRSAFVHGLQGVDEPFVMRIGGDAFRQAFDDSRAWIDHAVFAMAHAHYQPPGGQAGRPRTQPAFAEDSPTSSAISSAP